MSDGYPTDYGSGLLANNPHVEFYNAQRGFVLATATPTQWTTEFDNVLRAIRRAGQLPDGDIPFVRLTSRSRQKLIPD